VTERRHRLLFVSPVFLFPADTGGRIRTTNILRGIKGGAFEVTLAGPASDRQRAQWSDQLDSLCDHFVPWAPPAHKPRWRRAAHLLGRLPVNVVADRYPSAIRAVQRLLETQAFDVAVFDFVHCAVLRPARIDTHCVCFTHNVEAEIFERHRGSAGNPLMRAVWGSQARKMRSFEATALRKFDAVIAVSERDAQVFEQRYQVQAPAVIPTGVDLDYFAWQTRSPERHRSPGVVFTGSMDWEANIDGVRHFITDIWPRIRGSVPDARFTVVGRHPPTDLVALGRTAAGVTFTGLVDDVRPFVQSADVFVIPLRVGGGTRIKAFEAMAMGCPVVSTAVGIEGLDVRPDHHFLLRDDPGEFADAVIALITDPSRRADIAAAARRTVEARFGHRAAAAVFERHCLDGVRLPASRSSALAGVPSPGS
jgi:polysaccharide biosynthesis protein PslH